MSWLVAEDTVLFCRTGRVKHTQTSCLCISVFFCFNGERAVPLYDPIQKRYPPTDVELTTGFLGKIVWALPLVDIPVEINH